MAKRPRYERQSTRSSPGTIAMWQVSDQRVREIADRTTYEGNGQHKTYTSPAMAWVPALKSGKSKCGKYPRSAWRQFPKIIADAIRSKAVSCEFRGEYPSRLWAFINGTLHEARLTNEATGEYHAFPLEYEEDSPVDAEQVLRLCPNVTFSIN